MPLKMYSSPPPSHPLSHIKSILAIAAGKGGVGKSTVTVNLGLALQQLGYRVGIMDADLYGPSIRKMMREDRFPMQKGEAILPALCHGIEMISMAYFRQDQEPTAVRAPIANGFIQQFISQVQWGPLDFLLIDFPPGTGDIQMTLSQQAHLTGAVMVTTPQEVALLDVRKAAHLFQQVHVPVIGFVENMSYYQPKEGDVPVYLFGKGGGEKLALETGYPFLGNLPLDPDLCQWADQGQSLFKQDPSCQKPISKAFLQLSKQVAFQVEELHKQKGNYLSHFELIWKEMPTI